MLAVDPSILLMDEPFGGVDEVAVDVERPRDRTSQAFAEVKASVLAHFREHAAHE